MKAMVLAAGLGTRLRPLTDDRPKALVEVAGKTLLEITLSRLRASGIHDVVVNAHHFADKIAEYLQNHDNFGMHIDLSRENVLLDTGGGLKNADSFLLDGAGADEPFVLHNVDVISNINLQRMAQQHIERQALATLAVQHRGTSRYLLFDQQDLLCGRYSGNDLPDLKVRPCEDAQALGFCGIHILSPRIFSLMQEVGAFSIITTYLRLAAAAERIVAYTDDESYWRDLGTPDSVAEAEQDLLRRRVILQ